MTARCRHLVLILCFWLQEMGSRHRARAPVIQIIKTATVPAAMCKRDSVKQFHDSNIRFPLPRRSIRCVWQLAQPSQKCNAPGRWH